MEAWTRIWLRRMKCSCKDRCKERLANLRRRAILRESWSKRAGAPITHTPKNKRLMRCYLRSITSFLQLSDGRLRVTYIIKPKRRKPLLLVSMITTLMFGGSELMSLSLLETIRTRQKRSHLPKRPNFCSGITRCQENMRLCRWINSKPNLDTPRSMRL